MKSLMMTKYGDIGTSLEEQEVSIPTVGANQILIKLTLQALIRLITRFLEVTSRLWEKYSFLRELEETSVVLLKK